MSDDRKNKILTAIIKHFTETAEPVGSNTLIVNYKFQVSPATIRNDMASLEKAGLIYQPYTSAGRVPTDEGYRLFVDQIADYEKARELALQSLKQIREEYQTEKARERIFDAVSILSRATNAVSFATTPEQGRSFFLGLSNVLRQPEFVSDGMRASKVVEVLENNDNFIKTLDSFNLDDQTHIFIGKENIIEQIQSCSIIVSRYEFNGFKGYLGILGPTRMAYAYNRCVIEEVKNLLESGQSMT